MQVGDLPVVAGRYRLERLLGSGGMSEVWLAYDTTTEQPVALKRVLPGAGSDAREALLREAEIGQRLQHPNIVQVLDSGEANGEPFLVAEYVSGPSLRELLSWRGALPEEDVQELGRAVAAALAHAHGRGVIHNDLKPENILMDPLGPKVADFGAASSLTQTVGPQRARELMGTLAYLAPEVLQGETPSPRSDIYALGLTLYEAAAGRLPFPGATPAAVAGQRLAQPAPPLRAFVPSASPQLEATLMRALQLDPALRFETPHELAASLVRGPAMQQHPTVVIRRNGSSKSPPPTGVVEFGGAGKGGVVAIGLGLVGLLFAGGALALALVLNEGDNGDPDSQVESAPGVETSEVETPEVEATPTPTEPPAAATADPDDDEDDADDDEGDRRGRGRNRGRGNSGDDDDRGSWRLPSIPNPRGLVPTPSRDTAEEWFSDFIDSVREAIEQERE